MPLLGCQGMGIGTTDPGALAERYTDEQSRFIEIDGVRIHSRAEGSGPALLMLHGALDSLHAWDAWTADLKDTYRIIRIDIPPFGLSDPLPRSEYVPERYTALFDAVLDAYGIEDTVVIGNSLGGYFGSHYAANAPERVTALVLISPAGYPQEVPLPLRIAAMPVIGKLFEHVTPRPLARRIARSLYGEPDRMNERALQRRIELLRAPGNRPAARDVIRVMVDRAHEKPDWVDRISQPTLLMWGEADEWVPPALADRWQNDLQDVRLTTYPGVGHLAMEEVPQTSLRDLRRFLAGVHAPDAGDSPDGDETNRPSGHELPGQ